VQVAPFRIEQYYARHEFTAAYMLSSSDAESVAVVDLLALEPEAEERLRSMHLGYTESPGGPSLRRAIAAVYRTAEAEDVIVVSAAEEGIFTAYHALLRPGDHVVVETPCYESALELARSAGAEATEWRRAYAEGWAHDLEALERALRPDTRLVYVNTPHNPTGTLMPLPVLERVVELAAERGAWLFCDEVYRELEHDPLDRLPAAVDLYERAISLGSMSKTYGLPGLRLGWLASRDREALGRVLDFKHYTTISSSAPSELLSEIALRHREALVERNRAIVHRNLPLLDAFLDRQHRILSWVRPTASPIGFARIEDVDDVAGFCERLVAETGVLLLPGTVYDEPAHVRLGFGRENMPEALARFEAWLDRP
jgi:aspartate/methionine/tyrosine aminotransferase